MAPIQGHLMVPKAMRIVKFAITQAKSLIRLKVPTTTQARISLDHIRTLTQKSIAVHPIALLKQSKPSHSQPYGSRSHSTAQGFASKFSGPKYDRSSFPTSRTSRAIAQKGAAPFASTLRPNLTGGTLPRSAGGYSLGGAGRARQFGHTAGCHAQVLQNVSTGIRAFLVNGSKARFDGIDPVTGNKNWKAVTETQNQVYEKWAAAATTPRNTPRGTSLEFHLSPTITALLPTSSSSSSSTLANETATAETTLNSPTILHTLSTDFARALHDLALITHDLTKLSTFGDLPLSLLHTPSGPVLRVRFPGCDADAVSALCDEVGVRRGVVMEDACWAEDNGSRDVDMALLFPFAPAAELSEELGDGGREYFVERERVPRERGSGRDISSYFSEEPMSGTASSSESGKGGASTLQHHQNYDFDPLLSSSSPEGGSGYDSLSEIYDRTSDLENEEVRSAVQRTSSTGVDTPTTEMEKEKEYEGVEGIYRFLREIESARRL